jgi:hypothetical protein
LAVEWLTLNPPNEPIALDQAIKLAKHGGKRTKGEKQGVDNTLMRGSTNRAYILARLDRDGRTELAKPARRELLSHALKMAETWPDIFSFKTKDLPYQHYMRIAVCGLPLADRNELHKRAAALAPFVRGQLALAVKRAGEKAEVGAVGVIWDQGAHSTVKCNGQIVRVVENLTRGSM